jgi:hypothetical protein
MPSDGTIGGLVGKQLRPKKAEAASVAASFISGVDYFGPQTI